MGQAEVLQHGVIALSDVSGNRSAPFTATLPFKTTTTGRWT